MIQFVCLLSVLQPTNEVGWSKVIALDLKGRTEVVTPDGSRCDIVTGTHAYEVEWAYKWKEAPAQAILYSVGLNKKPAVILLVKDRSKEQKYILRCMVVCSKLNIQFNIRDVGKD